LHLSSHGCDEIGLAFTFNMRNCHLPLLVGSLLLSSLAAQQTEDPAYDLLVQAYEAARSGDASLAAAYFEQAHEVSPSRLDIAKDLAYAYLRLNWKDDAVRVFQEVVLAAPDDQQARAELAALLPAAPVKLIEQPIEPPLGIDDLDRTVEQLKQKTAVEPQRADIRKELGYAYLKTGESGQALQAFEKSLEADPGNDHTALEIAFLSHETGQQGRAFELFQTLADSEDAAVAENATATLTRLDELSVEIERWTREIEQEPLNRSAHLELARLHEKHSDPEQAALRYLAAWSLPAGAGHEEILLSLARTRADSADPNGTAGAWLLASRSTETRIAEQAKEELPARYPYASEFRAALDLDPSQVGLRRDLAYLLLEVGWNDQATAEFEQVCARQPDDLLSAAQLAFLYLEQDRADDAAELLERARGSSDEGVAKRAKEALESMRERGSGSSRAMGEKSLNSSYLKDARNYFSEAYRLSPEDHSLALKLGIVNNLLKQDREALDWFRVASASDDPDISTQAMRSYENLAPQFRRVTHNFWAYPFFSSRWNSVFGYAQFKTEFRVERLPVKPYLSMRLAGDARRRSGGAAPQFLSESSLIAAAGIRTPTRRGVTAWAEAGQAISYLGDRPSGVPRAAPDYRGGVSFVRNRGPTLGSDEPGRFIETNFDGVYISRFDDNVMGYWQMRPGYRLPTKGLLRAQIFMNFNLTADIKRQYWANFAEVGPGIKLRVPAVKPAMDFSVSLLRGVHLRNEFNPRRPNYFDLRVGVWYSVAK
jgi:tetratricopeptide (TPR) repeat protein